MISCKYVFIQCTIYKETIVTGNLLKLKQNWQEAPDWCFLIDCLIAFDKLQNDWTDQGRYKVSQIIKEFGQSEFML